MELCSLQSPTVSCSSTPRNAFFVDNQYHHPFLNGQSIKLPNNKKYPDARKLKFVSFKSQASGTTRSSSVTVEAITEDIDSKDKNLVFVAGATGKVGLRTVRELLKLGFKVRAGVRSVQRAETLVKSVEQMKLDEEIQPIKKLEIVECDLEKPDMIGPALGNASIVVCCIGASEKEIFDVTGPCRIDYRATKSLIDAATAAKANHFILVTSLGTNKFGFPAAILNLFWGVLIWKRKAEEALLASGIPYTIVRPGRPTDSYKDTHNVTLSVEDTLFGGQVSNLQVAELIAYMSKNRSSSYCKVVEVIAETTAPLTPFGELLEKIPSQRVEVYKPKEPVAAEVPKPSASTETEPTPAKETATRPLSPFANYEDLKPPTSPCPTASGPKEIPNDVTKVGAAIVVDKDPPPTTNYCHSPFPAYNDFKPPASPSPSSPIIKLVSTSPSNGAPQIADVSGNGAAQSPSSAPQTRPLSPFAMYEEMKPPTSPSPSSPKN